ncbi:MAG: hypothetical protein JO340_20485 [Acidobacteriaceae bacterium]|nr:hypothetical protein [Acidobacteriaceae bacterium]
MRKLGWLEQWLEATASAQAPAVSFSSLFPYQGDTLFVPPPKALWPPAASQVTASSPVFLSKMRWSAARFVPVLVVESLALGQKILADQWLIDAQSGCLLRRDRPNSTPFHTVRRRRAAIDRVNGAAPQAENYVGIEFEAGAGLWTVARYANDAAHEEWNDRIAAVFRFLADAGLGGLRTAGWGHAASPEFQQGRWPALLMPKMRRSGGGDHTTANGEKPLHWLLSVYSPSPSDVVDWSLGDYRAVTRGGRVESEQGWGAEKKTLRMIAEGSVIAAEKDPVGIAVNVAPDGFPHPVYRSGLALALRLPEAASAAEGPVETPSDEEAGNEKPCMDERAPEPEIPPVRPAAQAEEAAAAEEVASTEEAARPEAAAPIEEAAPESEPALGEEQSSDEL